MNSNEDRVDAVLDQMEQSNDPTAFSEGLNILCKLTANIISNPFEPKYRGIKITNNTIKTKIMALKNADKLLLTLGFVQDGPDMYVLRDEQISDFLQGEAAVSYRRRLAAARQSSQADYDKEVLVIKVHKQQRAETAKRQQQSKRLKDKCKYDQQERAHMKVDQTKSNQLKFGSKANTYKDIGVDLCKKSGGG